MPDKQTYYDLLKHPKWQEKRLQVFERAGFECEHCGEKEITLHVHHSYYTPGLKPWEYPLESLHCFCQRCHDEVRKQRIAFDQQVGKIGYPEIDHLFGYALGIQVFKDFEDDVHTPINVWNYEVAEGMADYCGLNVDFVIAYLIKHDGNINVTELLRLIAIHGAPHKPWLERLAKEEVMS
jgi:hypothetical protein